MKFYIQVYQFLKNCVDLTESKKKTFIPVPFSLVRKLFYGDGQQEGYLQDFYDDDEIYELLIKHPCVQPASALSYDVDIDRHLFNQQKLALVKDWVSEQMELMVSVEDLIKVVGRNPLFYRVYWVEKDGAWMELEEYAEKYKTGEVNQEVPEKSISEENNQESSNKITKEALWGWEDVIKFCITNNIFSKAYHHYDIYWAGQANPRKSIKLCDYTVGRVKRSLRGILVLYMGKMPFDG